MFTPELNNARRGKKKFDCLHVISFIITEKSRGFEVDFE